MRSWNNSTPARIATIAGLTGILLLGLFLLRRKPEELDQPSLAPLVRTMVVRSEPHRFTVRAHGAVTPRTESDLIPEVSGEIVWISPAFAAGGFFEKGEPLARIDAADYRVDLEAARATVARATSEFARAEKELRRQRQLADRSVASESRIDDAVNAFKVAEASLREAEARLERSERDLARTEIKAPYRGRVRSEQVDVGQFVNRGTPIATLYSVDYAEVRLPLPDRELAYLDVPLIPRSAGEEADPEENGPRVELEAEFAGALHRWEGHLVRTEGELDPRSRMVHVVARVRDPYGLVEPRSAPLAVGLFVNATIEGERLEKAYVLPRDALRPGGRVYVVDESGLIRFRDVDVLRTERSRVILGGGLRDGERVCTSPLEAAIDGMAVRLLDVDEAPDLADAPPTATAPRSNALQ
ncbi:MAG: efflux RND transporter periplasmic adaptor subunit [Deltaproteobacteria bacterium]|nr:efflux RND transporter periplasmic adaptor subunit [Deltaproteobacteria bacterium]MBW2498705.1 efflux RND transporter periplasmic adaptor subunit [Deltaproteobacteria bacterium]